MMRNKLCESFERIAAIYPALDTTQRHGCSAVAAVLLVAVAWKLKRCCSMMPHELSQPQPSHIYILTGDACFSGHTAWSVTIFPVVLLLCFIIIIIIITRPT